MKTRQFIHGLIMLKLKTGWRVFIITRPVWIRFFTKTYIFPILRSWRSRRICFIRCAAKNLRFKNGGCRRYGHFTAENIWFKIRKTREIRIFVCWVFSHFFIVQIWFHFQNIEMSPLLRLKFIVTSTFLQNFTLPICPTTILSNGIIQPCLNRKIQSLALVLVLPLC